jgi:tetratricopeptide (TPR) repeat protein
LVHFFLQDSTRHAQLQQYLEKWGAGMSSERAIKEAMGLEYAQLDAQLQEYASRESFDCVELRSKNAFVPPRVEVHPISKAEAYFQVAEVLLSMGGDLEEAREALVQALALQPEFPEAIGALARIHVAKVERAESQAADADLQQAEDYLQRARALAPDSPERFAIAGHIALFKADRAQDAGDEGTAEAELVKARTAYRKAIRAEETLVEAYFGLGVSYLIRDTGSEEAQVVLEAAAYLVPLAVNVALALGQLHVQRNDAKAARPVLEHVVLWGGDDARVAATELLRGLP